MNKIKLEQIKLTPLSVFSSLLSTTDLSSHSRFLRFRAAPDLPGISEVQNQQQYHNEKVELNSKTKQYAH